MVLPKLLGFSFDLVVRLWFEELGQKQLGE